MTEIVVFKLSETCRVCLKKENAMTNIQYKLLSLIANCEITLNNIFPNFICETCDNKLNMVKDLKLKFERTNIVLKECFKVYKYNAILFPQEKLSSEQISKLKATTKIKWNIDETCRVCLLKTDSMFSLESPETDLEYVFPSLSLLSNCEVSFDKLFPNFICTECNTKLRTVHDLKSTFERTNSLLTQSLKLLKPEVKPPDHNYSVSESEAEDEPKQTVSLASVEAALQKVRSIYEDKHKACFLCDFVGEHTHALRCHIGHFHKEVRNSWCSECNETFPDLAAHTLTHLSCEFCPKTFHKKQQLLHHLPTHAQLADRAQLFKCATCSQSCTSLKLLMKHSKMHRKELLKCQHCSRTFCTEHGLRIHVRCVHKLNEVKEKQSKNYCKICDTRVLSISRHNESFHGIPADAEEDAKTLKSLCNVCGKRFPNECKLKAHLRVHTGEKPFQCDVCAKKFSKRSLLMHHQQGHTGVKPYICQFCDKGFTSSNSLKIHEQRHLGQRIYTCKLCNKQFINAMLWKVHANKHKLADVERFKCEICGKSFALRIAFQVHMRGHSDERPYLCCFCNKGFKNEYGLRKHESTHSGEKQYKCNLCPYVGRMAFGLKIHMSKHAVLNN